MGEPKFVYLQQVSWPKGKGGAPWTVYGAVKYTDKLVCLFDSTTGGRPAGIWSGGAYVYLLGRKGSIPCLVSEDMLVPYDS